MAAGDRLLNADGDVMLDSNGDVRLDPGDGSCCFVQLLKCSDSSASGKWLKKSDIPSGKAAAKYSGTCHKFSDSKPCKPSGDTLLTAGDVTFSTNCAGCGSECSCNYDLVVTVGSPFSPSTYWGTYDLIYQGPFCGAEASFLTADFDSDEATGAGIGWTSDSGGRWLLGLAGGNVVGGRSAVAEFDESLQIGPCPDEASWNDGATSGITVTRA